MASGFYKVNDKSDKRIESTAQESDRSSNDSGIAGKITDITQDDTVAISSISAEEACAVRVLLLPQSGKMQRLRIPMEAEGKFQFEHSAGIPDLGHFYLWGSMRKWTACCIKPAFLMDAKGDSSRNLELGACTMCEIRNIGQTCRLYAEYDDDSSNVFTSYQILTTSDIKIGSKESFCDIAYSNRYVSGQHAVISRRGNSLYVKDCQSAAGTWVNGLRIEEAELEPGDRVTILGLEIIAGSGFISINDKQTGVKIRGNKLVKLSAETALSLMPPSESAKHQDVLFNRMPRRIAVLEPTNIQIEAPPMSINSSSIPMLLRMGSPLAMGGASAMAGNYIMLLSMVLFPFLTQKYSEKEKKEYETRRLAKYREYLDGKRQEILDEKSYEESVLRQNYPAIQDILKYPVSGEHLWEKSKTDEDFLKLRIGSGEVPMQAEIEYPKTRFNMDEDVLEKEMYELATTPVFLENAPILADFAGNFVCSVSGPKQLAYAFAKRLMMSMAVLNSYDEVKLVVLAEPEDIEDELEFVKYIPHVWDDQKNMRYIATSPSEAYQIGERIKQDIEADLEDPREIKEMLKSRPYYMVFALSKRIFDSMEILKSVMQQDETCGVSVITIFDDLPKECSLLFDISTSGTNTITYLKEITSKADTFSFDTYDRETAEAAMKAVANTSLKAVSQAYSLPKSLAFLEMYDAGRIEHLNIMKRWTENNPIKTLAAPVGVATDGSPFCLDLHQKYQGPHGLIAGTTGSGKSEFLITYILSMAINYRPEEVAFVLIDYKGGGLAGAFDDPVKGIHLPHLVGTITNLDGPAIERSLLSIESELTRRQRIFKEARSLSNEGTMDIYSYQKLYRAGTVTEPVPHLFIICDEFAELKQQQPEFMDELISAARIGRSLGVHLILATQKPSGVVNDQIRSNTKFRVCLKVQDKNDSMDMLKRPEAAEIKEIGRFYLQVGYNEFFALGQSGWTGAPYEPQDEVIVRRDDSIRIVDAVGQTVAEEKPDTGVSSANETQLVAIVRALSDIAAAQNIPVRQLWEPPLSRRIDLNDLPQEEDDSISIPVGMIDDPENQKQYVMRYDFEKSQHLLIAGLAASGKTQLIQSMIYSLAGKYTPDDVNFFILDYSSRLLKQFGKLPHTSAALLDDDADRTGLFFGLIDRTIAERKALFSELGVDNYSTARKMTRLPLILVFIDNFAGFSANKFGESFAYNLNRYLKEGLNYGVKFIISCNHLNDMTTKVRQELGDRICFAMKDRFEFSDGLNCRVSYVPPAYPGRGLVVQDGRPLEFQAAIYNAQATDLQRLSGMAEETVRLAGKYCEYRKAPRLPVADINVTYETFAEQFAPGRIPLGFYRHTDKAVALPLKQFSLLSIYQGNEDGVIPVLENMLLAARNENMNIWAITKSSGSYFDSVDFHGAGYGPDCRKIRCDADVLEEYWHTITDEILSRKELRRTYCEQNGLDIDSPGTAEQCFAYMRQNTRPLLLLIENHAEFTHAADDVSAMVYDKIFRVLDGLNVYAVSFFFPDDSEEDRRKILYFGFNVNGIAMLFGGRLDEQSIVLLDDDEAQTQKDAAYNECLMQYRSGLYPLIMPCRVTEEESVDTDSRNIFL